VVTEIDTDVSGDAHAPQIDARFDVVNRDPTDGWHRSASGLRYRFLEYRLRDAAAAG
jgi:dihydrofolate reductase